MVTNRRMVPVMILAGMTLAFWGMAAAALGAADLSDGAIGDAVADVLVDDFAVTAGTIDVETQRGVVYLNGRVADIRARDRAERLAETVRGVVAVVNNLEVAPPARADAAIRTDIEGALLNDPVTEATEVTVAVEKGVVSLAGRVDSRAEKRLASRLAKGIRGVRDVNNMITVMPAKDRTDREIKTEIESRLAWDGRVDDGRISVAVSDGRVRLSGAVGSAAEKRRAVQDAWVAGVRSVSADGLAVEKWARDPAFRKDKYGDRSDSRIESAVVHALAYDPRVDEDAVTVAVTGGQVTLRGAVETLRAKRRAGMDARNIVGVTRVINRLKVRPTGEVSAETLAKRVISALEADPHMNRYDIGVRVRNGIATLYGEVSTYFEKLQADDVASAVKGVVAVKNNLTVDRTDRAVTYNPYVDRSDIYEREWYRYTPRRQFIGDDALRDEIVMNLYWSPYVDSDDVEVTVEDGTAILSGTVASINESQAARRAALNAGAARVRNRLSVE
jgi:osmotically-inducible protein OsmY